MSTLYSNKYLRPNLIFFTVPTCKDILKKESFNNWYKVSTYFAALTVANIPVQVSVLQIHYLPN
jgi:hypothetical protein